LNTKDKIVKITYYYSQNKSNPNFGQSQLSNERYENLINKLPQAGQEGIEWKTVVQNSCDDNECAEQLFHGFVIEYEQPTKTKIENKMEPLLGHHQIPKQSFRVDVSIAQTIKGNNGTEINIPANAFVDRRGREVKGFVTVFLQEAITTEDIVLGNLFTKTEDNEILQSKGMINIQAFKVRNELQLKDDKSLTVSIPTGFEEGYSYYQGTSSKAELKWNNPVPIVRNVNIVERWGKGGRGDFTPEKVVSFAKSDGIVTDIKIRMVKGDEDFQKISYSKRIGRKKGLTRKQQRVVKNWFDKNDVVVQDLFRNKDRGLFKQGFFFWNCWSNNNLNFYADGPNSDLLNVFKMEKMGWANVDRLAKMNNTKLLSFNVAQDKVDSLQNFTISLVVPKKNIFLPGFQRNNGTYAFTHGEYEDRVPMPVGEKAYVIALGEKNGDTYFQMKEVRFGDRPVEHLSIAKTDRKDALEIIKKAL
jgi:hypothetical protein